MSSGHDTTDIIQSMPIKSIHTVHRKLTNSQAKFIIVTVYMIVLFILTGTAYVTNSTVFADSPGSLEEFYYGIALPGEECRVPALPSWSRAEKWAWKEICENKHVNFNEHLNENLDPTHLEHDDRKTDGRRTLSATFLNTILLYEPFRSTIPYRGVRISGAYIHGEIDLTNAVLERPLYFFNSIFGSEVYMSRLFTPTSVAFIGSRFYGNLNMDFASIGGSLFMQKSMGSKDVSLIEAKIGGRLSMDGSTFNGELDMDAISVGSSLLMRDGAQFNTVDLKRAKIDGQLSMDGSTFNDELDMDAISVGSSLLMRDGAQFSTVVLREAKIDGQLGMDGSTFNGELNMNTISVGSSLLMRDGAQFSTVGLIEAKIGGQLAMDGSTFNGELVMDTISIGSSLFMNGGAQFNTVSLGGSKIGGQLAMDGSTFYGELSLEAISVGSSLLMRGGTQFNTVRLIGAKIDGLLGMDGSIFNGELVMDAISVGSSLFMRDGAHFSTVRLIGAKIDGQLVITSSTFYGDLDMDSAFIGRSLILSNAEFENMTNLTFLSVGSNLEIQSGTFRRLDLTGTRIEQTLKLSAPYLKWKKLELEDKTLQSPKMTLKNAEVNVLQDTDKSWPDHLELEGFTYNHLASSDLNQQKMPFQRGSKWFIDWLEDDKTYSPQPYRQLAGVLRVAGLEEMANDIQYASRDRMLSESSWREFNFWFLGALKIFIGYGIGGWNFLALAWMTGFAIIGTGILCISKERYKQPMLRDRLVDRFFYSLDMILPIIHLREQHYEDVDLFTWAKYYFYFHKIMGYILVLFVIAGLSGLTE